MAVAFDAGFIGYIGCDTGVPLAARPPLRRSLVDTADRKILLSLKTPSAIVSNLRTAWAITRMGGRLGRIRKRNNAAKSHPFERCAIGALVARMATAGLSEPVTW